MHLNAIARSQDPLRSLALYALVARHARLILSAFVLLALTGVLVLLAGTQALWLDELTSFWFSDTSNLQETLQRMLKRGDPHPPGYQVLLNLWLKIPATATSTLTLRLSSIICCLSTAGLFYTIVRRLSHNQRAPLLFLILYATAESTLYYGVELRSYAFQQMAFGCCLLARDLLASERTLSNRVSRVLQLIFIASGIFLGLSHYVGSLLVGVLVFYELFLTWRAGSTLSDTRSWAKKFEPWLALLGPILAFLWLIRAAQSGGFNRTLAPPGLSSLTYYRDALGHLHHDSILVGLSLLMLSHVGNRFPSKQSFHRLAQWSNRTGTTHVLLGLLFLVLISSIKPILQKRNVIITIPSLLAITALILDKLSRISRTRRAIASVTCAAAVLSSLAFLRTELQSSARAGEDFWKLASLGEGILITNSDDLAIKLSDSAQISSFTRQPLPPREIRYLKASLGGENLLDAAPMPSQFVIAIPHWKRKKPSAILRRARAAGLSCRRLKNTAPGDRAWQCRTPSRLP